MTKTPAEEATEIITDASTQANLVLNPAVETIAITIIDASTQTDLAPAPAPVDTTNASIQADLTPKPAPITTTDASTQANVVQTPTSVIQPVLQVVKKSSTFWIITSMILAVLSAYLRQQLRAWEHANGLRSYQSSGEYGTTADLLGVIPLGRGIAARQMAMLLQGLESWLGLDKGYPLY